MPNTYDLGTDIGLVRLLIGDKNEDKTGNWLFSDDELQAFLKIENGSIYFAAADAIDTLAKDEALTWRSVKILDLSVSDGGASAALSKYADKLRAKGELDNEQTISCYYISGSKRSGKYSYEYCVDLLGSLR